jgi:hypothetical protein
MSKFHGVVAALLGAGLVRLSASDANASCRRGWMEVSHYVYWRGSHCPTELGYHRMAQGISGGRCAKTVTSCSPRPSCGTGVC